MKRFVTAPVLAVLRGALLLTTSCDSPPPDTRNQVYTCLGNIALQVAATLADAEELTFGKLISSASVCVDAAVAIFGAPSNSTPSSPEIDINSSSSDGTFSGSVRSTTVGNC